jgi:hypothetical protein
MAHYIGHWGTDPNVQANDAFNLGSEFYTDNPDFDTDSWTKNLNTEIGMNLPTFKTAGSVMSGLGSLGQAWAGLQNVKLGKQELAQLKDQWNKNYASQAITTNNQIANQNAWKTAQGRTDLGDLVPRYNNIG